MRLSSDRKPTFTEARRYFTHAEEILRTKAGRANGRYTDPKYVKMAGHTAWDGVLVAVDEYMVRKGIEKTKGRKDRTWYLTELSKLNRRIAQSFSDLYSALHLSMGYDGLPLRKPIKSYLEEARNLIRLCEKG